MLFWKDYNDIERQWPGATLAFVVSCNLLRWFHAVAGVVFFFSVDHNWYQRNQSKSFWECRLRPDKEILRFWRSGHRLEFRIWTKKTQAHLTLWDEVTVGKRSNLGSSYFSLAPFVLFCEYFFISVSSVTFWRLQSDKEWKDKMTMAHCFRKGKKNWSNSQSFNPVIDSSAL